MGLTTGLSITCPDLQRTGGISQIFLRTWDSTDIITFATTAGSNHAISSIKKGGADADWLMYEFKDETPTLNVTASKENGSTSFECVLSFYIPRMSSAKYGVLQEMLNTCMMGLVVDTNDKVYVIGASNKYSVGAPASGTGASTAQIARSQTYLNLTSMEGQTGAAYSEENGITVVLTARQFELPRLYSGTLTPDLAALTATTD